MAKLDNNEYHGWKVIMEYYDENKKNISLITPTMSDVQSFLRGPHMDEFLQFIESSDYVKIIRRAVEEWKGGSLTMENDNVPHNVIKVIPVTLIHGWVVIKEGHVKNSFSFS